VEVEVEVTNGKLEVVIVLVVVDDEIQPLLVSVVCCSV
jgi:hypothetical protein